MSVVIALSAFISFTSLHGIKPSLNRRVFVFYIISLIVIQTSSHSLNVRSENYIDNTEILKEIWPFGNL
jgi:hypothetical protein